MGISLTIDRTSLDKSEIYIPDHCQGPSGYWLGEGFSKPSFTPRYNYAPDSNFLPGKQLLSVVLDQGVINGNIYMRGFDNDDLEDLKVDLEEALWQFVFEVSLNDNEKSRRFMADPTYPLWGDYVVGYDRLYVARATVSIPISPVGVI